MPIESLTVEQQVISNSESGEIVAFRLEILCWFSSAEDMAEAFRGLELEAKKGFLIIPLPSGHQTLSYPEGFAQPPGTKH